MLFQIELDFIRIGTIISIINFLIGTYLMRWYARIQDKKIDKRWNTSLKTSLYVNTIWLITGIPIGILINFLFAKNLFLYLIIQFTIYILINLLIGIIAVNRFYKKKLHDALIAVLIIQLVLFGITLILSYGIFFILHQSFPNFFEIIYYIVVNGLPATFGLTAIGLLGGFVIGMTLAIMRVYGGKELNWFASGYEKLFRGIPILVLIFIFAVNLTFLYEICIGGDCVGIPLLWRPAFGVILALALRSGAYQSQIFRGAILSVGAGQEEAARALGMTRIQALRAIILPQALRIAIPSWSNEYAVVIKDTSFALTVGVVEMTNAALQISSNYIELWAISILAVAIIYFLITYPITKLLGGRQTQKLKNLGLGGA